MGLTETVFGTPGEQQIHTTPAMRPPGYAWANGLLNSLGSLQNTPFPSYQGRLDPGLSPTLQDTIRRAQGYAQSGPNETLQGAMGSIGRFMNPSFSNIWSVLNQGAPNFFAADPSQRLYNNSTVGNSGFLGSDPTGGGMQNPWFVNKPLMRPPSTGQAGWQQHKPLDFTTGGPQAQPGGNPFGGGTQVVSSNGPGVPGGMSGMGGQGGFKPQPFNRPGGFGSATGPGLQAPKAPPTNPFGGKPLFGRPQFGSASGGGLQPPISPPGFPAPGGPMTSATGGGLQGGGQPPISPQGFPAPPMPQGGGAPPGAPDIASLFMAMLGGSQTPTTSVPSSPGGIPQFSQPAQGVKTAWDMGAGANRGQVRVNPQTGQQEILMGAGGGEQYQWMPYDPNNYGHQQNAQMFQRYGQNWTSGSGATSFHSPDIAQILREQWGREPSMYEINDYYYGVRPMSELGY